MSHLDRTVLIIDDSPVERETYRRYLLQETGFTYTFWEAESAESALLLCDRQLPDSIVLDYLLPDMDGLKFLTEVQHRFSPCPPVVMLTWSAIATYLRQNKPNSKLKRVSNAIEPFLIQPINLRVC